MTGRSLIAGTMLVAIFLVTASWAGVDGKEYKFKGAPDGAFPPGELVSDGLGNFFGTTEGSYTSACGNNASSCGTAFEIRQGQSGIWLYHTIHTFVGGTDGAVPMGPLVLDGKGNIYGTAAQGGNLSFDCYCGTVFRLSPNQDGTWTNTTLYGFQGQDDGSGPNSGVIFDTAGSLYGTTSGCSDFACGGTVFKLSPNQGGIWTKTTLYTFPFSGVYAEPGPLVLDPNGNLYGTTSGGGIYNVGAAFELTPNGNSSWTEDVLYNFTDGLDGGNPNGGVTFDSEGNLYGEASWGGSFACPELGCGTIFELTPESGGTWQFSVVHTFNGLDGLRGQYPVGGLTLDSTGTFYGTTEDGGTANCLGSGYGCGTIFKVTPASSGNTFAVIGSFNGADGAYPAAGVILDAAGNLYGTAQQGGNLNCGGAPNGCGVVFMLTR